MPLATASKATRTDIRNPIYHDDDAARVHLETVLWPQGPVCPRCGVTGERITKLAGKSTRPGVLFDIGLPLNSEAILQGDERHVHSRWYHVALAASR